MLNILFGNHSSRYVKKLGGLVNRINALEADIKPKSDAELKALTAQFKERLAAGETEDKLLPEAFATVREAARRTLGERHYDVQLMGGIVLHRGNISEMKTGEGKTLVSTLPTYLNALAGKGAHVVTVNDYLAKRDAEWMAQVFNALGMDCRYLVSGMSAEDRKAAYAADITYATNNELGFDYLRDNMSFTADQLVQRGHHFAIVDEVDSILIDEARTPLIISGPAEDKTELYHKLNPLPQQFTVGEDYELDEKQRNISLTDAGMDRAEQLMQKEGLLEKGASLYDVDNVMLVHHLNQAMRAHLLFQKDTQYIIHEQQVMLIDEFTGRMTPGRRLSEGLHQAIEAKENVPIQQENQTLASVTYQNYFRQYSKLAGMTGTGETEAEEFRTIYGLDVIEIPTHRAVAREDEADMIYRTKEEKFRAIVKDIEDCNKRGQPTLVGTTSIEKSEELAAELQKHKVTHKVLNARHHEQEAEIIAQAGRLGAVTIATNMAGRGTDIKLGGNLSLLLEGVEDEAEQQKIRDAHEAEKAKVMEAGGLKVIGTERHESRRIDNQLRGRSGRQGDVGRSVFYISLQDDLMRIFARGLDTLMARMNMPQDEAIQSKLVSRAIATAQKKVEHHHFDVRKNLLKYDDVLNEQRTVIYAQRREVMESDTQNGDVSDMVADMRATVAEDLAFNCFPPGSYHEQWQLDTFKEEAHRLFNVNVPVDKWLEEDGIDVETIHERFIDFVERTWREKVERLGAPLIQQIEKMLLLQVIDTQWRGHLKQLDYLRHGIGWRGYAQKDPLAEYKREAFAQFDGTLTQVREQVLLLLSRAEPHPDDLAKLQAQEQQLATAAEDRLAQAEQTRSEPTVLNPEVKQSEQKYAQENPYANQNVPRNAPCPCGSGLKYKHCHGKLSQAA